MINEQKKAGDRNSVKNEKHKVWRKEGEKKRARESQIKQPENTSDTSGNIRTQG